ncbi:hypothetical protein [Priestia megaterium]|uniref:hypothetical protein n=1 Tax=Priestia megaterium TaxID=1404 RepID=UPI00372CF9A6
MEDNQEHEQQVGSTMKYIIGFIIITAFFGYASAIALLGRSTEVKDVYTAFCAILGGLVAGLITLAGVTRTIEAQRKITLEGVKATVEAQKQQEALKLIPQKLVALHNLTTEIESFNEEVKKITELHTYGLLLKNGKLPPVSDVLKGMNKKVDKVIVFFDNLNNVESKFIEVASKVDVDTYKTVKIVFDRLKMEYKWLKAREEMRDYMNKVYFALEVDAELFVELADPLIYKLNACRTSLKNNFKELESIIPEKLKQYEKEME